MLTNEQTQCPSCPRKFLTKTAFDWHQQTHRMDQDEATSFSGKDNPELTRPTDTPGPEGSSNQAQEFVAAIVNSEASNPGPASKSTYTSDQEAVSLSSKEMTSEFGSSSGQSNSAQDAVKQFRCQCCDKGYAAKKG